MEKKFKQIVIPMPDYQSGVEFQAEVKEAEDKKVSHSAIYRAGLRFLRGRFDKQKRGASNTPLVSLPR